jgi:hypothetical protein
MSATASAVMVALLLAAPAATAAPPGAEGAPFTLDRRAGTERCPDGAWLAARVAKRGAESRRAPRTDILIARTDEGYVGTVSVLGVEGGTRRLLDKSEDCAGLGEALALTLSMIADGQPIAAAPPSEPPAAVRAVRAWEIGAGAVASADLLGQPSLGITLDAVFYPWPRVAFGLDALWMPGRAIDKAGSTSRVQVAAALAKICWGFLPYDGRVFPALCGNLGGGALRGEGDRALYADARTVWRPWLAAGPALHAGIRLHRRLTFALHAGYLFSLLREHLTVGGADQSYPVYESGHPGWTGGAGLLVRIP